MPNCKKLLDQSVRDAQSACHKQIRAYEGTSRKIGRERMWLSFVAKTQIRVVDYSTYSLNSALMQAYRTRSQPKT